MIIGIEGTGSQKWSDTDMQHSFVRRILEQSVIRPKWYFIGPSDLASDSAAIRNGAWWKMLNNLTEPIVLVGYSRGAAYCLDMCLRYNRHFKGERLIHSMILFDAVRRDFDCDLPDADDIPLPDIVRYCLHAYRDPRAGSRYAFANVQPRVQVGGGGHPTIIVKRMFKGSHGSLGGTYWDAKTGENTASAKAGTTAANAVHWMATSSIPGVQQAGAAMIGSYDRNLVNAPQTAQTNEAEDKKASEEVAGWVWPQLIQWGVLPRGAQALADAQPFHGSREPGRANPVD